MFIRKFAAQLDSAGSTDDVAYAGSLHFADLANVARSMDFVGSLDRHELVVYRTVVVP
ncbi:hypothetical protein PC123_g11368 [Phytophthora cactorum]|nr:hypothetical protein PC123_g11368 [Phytophthora cactorum]